MKTAPEPKEKKHLPTINTLLDKRKQLANGKYNACITIQFNGKRKQYPITSDGSKLRLKPSDLRKLEVKAKFEDALTHAKDIVKGMPAFTFEAFEQLYYSDVTSDNGHLVGALLERSKQMYETQLKTAIGYTTTANIVQKFIGEGKRIEFFEITPGWLNSFDKWLLQPYKVGKKKQKTKPGRSLTTVGIYMRNIRTVSRPHLTGKDYPFGASKDGKYEIPSGRNVKKALSLQDIAKIYNYDAPQGSDIQYFRDLWLLSYLCNGANFKDLARLKYEDLDGENISFIRSKTAGTKRTRQGKVVVVLTKEVARIIDRWGTKGKPQDYILPILKPGLTPKQELDLIESVVKRCNRTMRQIAENALITQDITTYSARHSFANITMRSGATIEYISKALGHSSAKTTSSYLSDFDTETKRAYAEKLTAFVAK